MPKVSHGEVGYVFDSDGQQYLDGSGGLPFTGIGYGRVGTVFVLPSLICGATINVRARIASPTSVPKEQCRCLTRMFSIASLVVPEI
ncbi:hypothetical protein [Mesorhizobium sp. M0244]|uniref:hypothetical protein n=1 Tax=Mesorhizobium sp. M0244 TaxID=2956926 RepID=UPI00333B11B6